MHITNPTKRVGTVLETFSILLLTLTLSSLLTSVTASYVFCTGLVSFCIKVTFLSCCFGDFVIFLVTAFLIPFFSRFSVETFY